MKKLLGLLLAISLLAGSLYWQRDTPWMRKLLALANPQSAPLTLPHQHDLTDARGREIAAEILGFNREELAFRRRDNGAEFVISLSSLSPEDREFFSQRPPQEEATIARVRSDSVASGQVSHASWFQDIEMAKREAGKTGRPILLAFVQSEGPGAQLDRDILRAEAFRAWANQTVVLCLYHNETRDTGLQTASRDEARDLAKRHGIGMGKPGLVFLTADGKPLTKALKYQGESLEIMLEKLRRGVSGG